MPYIYKIINDINNKVYIGQTTTTIEERFKEHLYEVDKGRHLDWPLYAAMKKYGVQHFKPEIIEETSELDERERFWIEVYRSFKNGYNATIGGGGRPYVDYDLVVETYKQTKSMKDTANIMQISEDTVSDVLKMSGEPFFSSYEVITEKYGKQVNMFTLDNVFVQTFCSMGEAARYLIENDLTKCKFSTIRQHIAEVCRGDRKSAAKFLWRCVEV